MSKKGRRSVNNERKELERLRAQIRSIRRFGFFSTTGKVLCEALRSCRIILPFFCIWLTVRDWPQHEVQANLTADVSATVAVESQTLVDALSGVLNEYSLYGLLLLLALCGVAYGRFQGKLRRDDVERLSAYKERYESLKDPQRSSSRLTARGETRPEDE